jgi:acetolactate decarboxylase
MRVTLTFYIIGGCFLWYLPGCTYEALPDHRDLVYQRSTIDALLPDRYDDTFSFEHLARHGDFGIGTLNSIDGEMLALDGAFYQIKTNGIPYLIPKDMHTPFATVKFFKTDSVIWIPENLNYTDLLSSNRTGDLQKVERNH